jgi:hypothetical protein
LPGDVLPLRQALRPRGVGIPRCLVHCCEEKEEEFMRILRRSNVQVEACCVCVCVCVYIYIHT